MTSAPVTTDLLTDFSLEMTGKDADELRATAPSLPAGTRVHVTFLSGEDLAMRVDAAGAVRRAGLVPVPHVSARRLQSAAELHEFLAALADVDAARDLFIVGGDPTEPLGPFDGALSLIVSGALADAGAQHVGLAGYPEGHPDIADDVLWSSLHAKLAALAEQGISASLTTQFAFDEEPVLAWIERVRDEGIDVPIRVGVPGPAGVRRLVSFATRFGVGANALILKKYGFSLAHLIGSAGPEKFLAALEDAYDPARHGSVGVHFYTFGGIAKTAEWVRNHRAR